MMWVAGVYRMNLDDPSEKLKLEYPCEWTYKVIGTHSETILKIVQEMMQERRFTISLSNKSKTKKYCSMNFVTQVESEEDRNTIYKRLKNHKDVVMVL